MNVITVLSGSFGLGMGDKLDTKGELLGPGSVVVHPGKTAHFVWTGNQETIIQVQGIGPGAGIEYVNAADDPRKK